MKTNSTKKRYWKIQGWDGTRKLFESKVGAGQITRNRMKELLRTLTAKISLNDTEIISSYAKKGTTIHYDHLIVQVLTGNRFAMSCGTNPIVIAVIEDE